MTKPKYQSAEGAQSTSSSQPNAKATTKTKSSSSVFSRIAAAAKRATNPPRSTEDRSITNGIAAVLLESGNLPVALGEPHHANIPQGARCSATNHGTTTSSRPTGTPKSRTSSTPPTLSSSTAPKEKVVPSAPKEKVILSAPKASQFQADIFPKNMSKPKPKTAWPKVGERIETTLQLALCATLLPKDSSADTDSGDTPDLLEDDTDKGSLDGIQLDWLKAMEEPMKQNLVRELANGTVDKYVEDSTKNADTIAEAVLLGPILDREYYRILLDHTIRKFENSSILDSTSLQGLVQVVQGASPGYLEADDLRRILGFVRARLLNTLQQSTDYVYHLTLAVSRILDVMADNKVEGLERVKEHEALSAVLSGLKSSSDPFLLYQASYAFQALQYVPHDETTTQAVLRHSAGVAESMIKLSAVLKLDVSEFFNGLKGLTEVAGNLYQGAKSSYEAVNSLVESGRGVFDSLKDAFGSGYRRQWYLAIRQADSFIRNGRLAELNRLICEAPCRKDPFFQWGICQLLGELAADSNWDIDSRKQAVDFLLALHKNDTDWGQDASVRTWTLTLLERLSKLPIDKKASTRDVSRQDQAVTDHALTSLKGLAKDVADGPAFRSPYPLRSRLPLPKTSTLLKRVELQVGFDLDRMNDQRLSKRRQGVYIPPLAKANLKSSDNDSFPLMEYVEEFLASDRLVLLILGDSGSGKSTFNRHLEHELWNDYNPDKEDDSIPLYINLAAIEQPEQDLIAKQLAVHNITQPKIQELKERRRFVLICDGYDETKTTTNLYVMNQLNRGEGHWRAKMVISCRSTKLGHDYQSQFMPISADTHRGRKDLFQEAAIVPFTTDQIQGYINQYVLLEHLDRPQWNAEDYNDTLTSIPSLMGLVKNPFLLTIALEAMPSLVGDNRAKRDLSRITVNRLVLYDAVVQQWITRAEFRLSNSRLREAEELALDGLRQLGFKLKVMEYLKDLAADIFKEQQGHPLVRFSEGANDAPWKAKFFGRTPETTVLRLSSPLVRNGFDHSFIHLSVLDYFFARVVYDPDQSSDLPFANHPLAQRSIRGDQSILQFLAERVQQESEKSLFKQQLLDIIEASKTDIGVSLTAANAITILVRAGVRFNGADLKGIQIRGADLSGGQFDSAQFQGADLRGVKLNKTWIRQADFSDADMTGVQFGELPHIKLARCATACSYSPDGKTFAVGSNDGEIEIFDAVTWTRIRTLSDPIFASDLKTRTTGDVVLLAYSPKGDYLVSGSEHNKLGVWNYHTGELCRVLKGHSMSVSSVAVSPDGLQIASGSRDETVRLWKLKTGEVEYVLKGHAEAVAVAYSPDGRQLASGGREGTVRIWNTRTGETERVLERESYGGVNSVAFSSDGRRMASAHNGGQIQLWNAETRQPGRLLIGHAKSVMGVTFSPNNQWIASAGWDFTVRLWDSETGVLCNILLGHTLFVSSVSFSPTSPQFTSCSRDKTVRIWELQDLYTSGPSLGVQDLTEPLPLVRYSPTGQHVVSANREGEIYRWDPLAFDPQLLWRIVEQYEISSMAYSPKGLQIASAVNSPNDFSVRLWDSATGETGLVLTGHQDRVAFLSYSPCDRWIASASDDETVCIWDTQAAADNALVHTFKSHACGVGFSPDGRQIAYGGFNKKLWVRDASSGQLVATLRGHSELISTVDYSPDGALLASGSWDNTVRLWDTATHKPVVVLRGHSNWVLCLAFSSCGKWIASGSRDMTLRLWDVKSSLLGGSESEQTVQSSSCVSVVQPFAAFVTHVAWNPNGAMEFVTSTAVHSIQGWKMVMSHKDENRQGAGADDVDVVSVGLDWSSESNSLVGFGAKTAEAKGLNVFDRALLQQCETVEEFKLQGIDELDE